MITSKRMLNGHHQLLRDGVPVGEVWRFQRNPGARRRRAELKFGMRLDGYLWHREQPVKIGQGGGFAAVAVRRLCDAVELAAKVLEQRA